MNFFPSRKQTQTFEQRGHSEAKQLVVSCHHPVITNTTSSSFWGGGLSSAVAALPKHLPSETQTPGMGHAPPSCCLRTLHLCPSPPSGQLGNHPRHFWRCPQGDAGDAGEFGDAGGTPAVPPALPGTQHTLTHTFVSPSLSHHSRSGEHQGWIKDQAIYY